MALRAMAKLRGAEAENDLLEALRDHMAGVSRAARDLLRTAPFAPSASTLAPLLDAVHPRHVRRNALFLLLRAGKWTGLRWALRALESEDIPGRERAVAFVEAWGSRSNRSFARVTAEDAAAIRLSLERLEGQFGALHWIRWVLDRET